MASWEIWISLTGFFLLALWKFWIGRTILLTLWKIWISFTSLGRSWVLFTDYDYVCAILLVLIGIIASSDSVFKSLFAVGLVGRYLSLVNDLNKSASSEVASVVATDVDDVIDLLAVLIGEVKDLGATSAKS